MGQSPKTQSQLPVAAIFGPESFLLRVALDDLLAGILGPDPDHLTVSDLDGDSAELADVLDELRTLPLFGNRRVVILRTADGFITKHRKALEDYAAEPCPSGTLILVCKSLPSNTRLYKTITKMGRAVNCKPPRRHEVTPWIVQRCTDAHRCRIDTRAAARLRDLVGDSLGMLDNELAKLSLYAGDGQPITRQHIEELAATHREETVFGIIEAMLTGDAACAIKLWNHVWATDRAASARAIGGLAWALRRIVNAKAELDAGVPIAQVARQVWTDPARLRNQVDACSIGQLENLLAGLRDADMAAKTGRGSVRDAVERLIIQTACGGQADAHTRCA